MPRGTLLAFDTARGSGTLRLDGGEELHFDVSIANTSAVKAGAVAEVFTGLNRSGKQVAKVVLFEVEEGAPQPFAEGLARLRAVGLLSGMGAEVAGKSVGREPVALTRELAGALLITWYGSSRGKGVSARSLEDRVVCLDEHFGDSLSIPVGDLLALAPPERRETLRAATASLKPASLNAALATFNGALQDLGVAQRYFTLDIDSDVFVVVAVRDEDFTATVRSTVLRLVA